MPLMAPGGSAAKERGGWPSSPTGFGVGADEQVIGPGLQVLQWSQCLCKVLDERDPLHVLQWRAGGVLDQLHAVVSGGKVGPLPLTSQHCHLLNSCFVLRKQAGRLSELPTLRASEFWGWIHNQV